MVANDEHNDIMETQVRLLVSISADLCRMLPLGKRAEVATRYERYATDYSIPDVAYVVQSLTSDADKPGP